MTDEAQDAGTKPARLTDEQKAKFPLISPEPIDDVGQTLKVCSYLVIAFGVVALLTGGYNIIFGPETIRYNVIKGMTFPQFLQAYPGPIASLGFIAIALGRMLATKADQMQLESFNETLIETLREEDIEAEDLGDQYKLDVSKRKDGNIEIGLVDVSLAEPQTGGS
ncbi:hypothetical protein [Salinisphaera sp. Q1T1-3]|uniref:hypothetical protein n=1 Tax=Salinisphaera sp. Q1T1-3 TaxID=2321229 RepID=UPI000E710D60|nr:hypothetical protein [Salinisphaera sp. Q1T1-3]RJS93563.1 hypothetical protein D3260_07730 [Salinisphaera sp. Q1T1-3]